MTIKFVALISPWIKTSNLVLFSSYTPSLCTATFSSGDCLDPTLYPTPAGDFFAVSSYYWEFGSPLDLGYGTPLAEIQAKVDQACEGSDVIDCDYCSETDCFEFSYILAHLSQGYHFGEDSIDRVDYVLDVDGVEVSWAWGFVVEKSKELGPF